MFRLRWMNVRIDPVRGENIMEGTVFNIQKFSIHDGPGIRTTVFLKGCPLRCRWCANPESQSSRIEIFYDEKKCSRCGRCISACKSNALSSDPETGKIICDQNRCTGCLECVKTCPSRARTAEGERMEARKAAEACMSDLPFYEESGGGVTISGGEGMSQPGFVQELVSLLKKEGIHCAIETTGAVGEEVFQRLALEFDLILFDVKHADSEKHAQKTGAGNERILKNLKWAVEKEIPVLCRMPVIPGFNDDRESARQIALLLKKLGIHRIQLLPFHQMGENKYRLLHRIYDYAGVPNLHPEDLKDVQSVFLNEGVEAFF